MGTTLRRYDHAADYERINRLLVETYEPGDRFGNWLQPRWEYMNYHPLVREVDRTSFGVAEEDDRIIGMVHLEHSPALVYFQVRPGYEHIKGALLDHAEHHFGGFSQSMQRDVIGLYVDADDEESSAAAIERGFTEATEFAEEHSRLVLDQPIPAAPLPAGFRLQSLADENDLGRIARVQHRGFNHAGEPPPEAAAERAFMQTAPNFRKDLTIVAVSPDGDYVAFGGIWHVAENHVAYIEPVATDPGYRRMGLGRAVVLESVRRVAAEGATVAWVGSSLDFYKAIGFTTTFRTRLWIKNL